MQNPFKLTRRFAILGLLLTVAVSVASSFFLSRFMVRNLLRQDATVSRDFVQSVVEVQQAWDYFSGRRAGDTNLAEFFSRIAAMPHVVRTNVFSTERTIVWSSDPALIGKRFDRNPELEAALGGRLEVSLDDQKSKPEHVALDGEHPKYVVENYLPVRRNGEVIGVVEMYKSSRALFDSIDEGLQLIWLSGLGGGIFLYGVLVWVVLRAERIIRAQQASLVQHETLAALGTMASAVAHGIRNPLASIRSSAELNLDNESAPVREASEDIVDEVDRLERWVRDLLAYAVPEAGEPENVRVSQVLHDSLNAFEGVFAKRDIRVSSDALQSAAVVRGDHALLTQVFNCLLTNAMEAMPQGGELQLRTVPVGPGRLRVSISDTGHGFSASDLQNAFVPRRSTKRTGLGVGLPLSKRILERFGGSIELVSRATGGATVNVDLPIAR
jgi:two-component system, NtrC family, sensor histidine kinase HydH